MIAFRSAARNLVLDDTNDTDDVFLHDRITQRTTRVSVSSNGREANDSSFDAFVSPDGGYVGFASEASNLIRSDTNGFSDVFVRDLARQTTTRVSVSSAGAEGNALSFHASISAQGRYVAFHSRATNLVAPDANGFAYDVYVHDRTARTTERVSVSSAKTQSNGDSNYPKISADGRYVVFESFGSNLVPQDTNGSPDIFVRDRWTETTKRVSVSSSGAQGDSASFSPSLSADGRFITYRSFARNLTSLDGNNRADIFIHDQVAGTTELVSVSSNGEQGNENAFLSFVSADGRYVAFESFASNLVERDTNETWDVFVRDRQLRTTRLVSISTFGVQARWDAVEPAISADGRSIAFVADADNLVPADTNASKDIFVRGPFPR